ncbi:MAG: PAQR family membrane homeostasis protein TrhA [Acidimicrobiales bacterium]
MGVRPAQSEEVLERPLLRGWLHVGGAIALLGASPVLVARAHTVAQVAWSLCYVFGVAGMFAVSAAFHRVRWSPSARRAWRRADHTMIFVAIVGTYLAVIGLTLHGTLRDVITIVIAAGAVAGVVIGQWALDAPKWVNTLPYLVVGWSAVAVLPQIYRGGGPACFSLVVAGGVAYSLGALAYAMRRPRLSPRVFGYHELFHAATLAGASCHFAAVWLALR